MPAGMIIMFFIASLSELISSSGFNNTVIVYLSFLHQPIRYMILAIYLPDWYSD